mmetsp:Transcript_33709/g.78876  ORF Transcript_33709/g.78876 Transcript_33709/m.78876 type:complete len:277 (-) Transcript_33709:819-1649(-)
MYLLTRCKPNGAARHSSSNNNAELLRGSYVIFFEIICERRRSHPWCRPTQAPSGVVLMESMRKSPKSPHGAARVVRRPEIVLVDPKIGAKLLARPDRQCLVVRARVDCVWLVGEHRRPENRLALLGHEGDGRAQVGEARAAAAALGKVVEVHEQRVDAHALDPLPVAVDVVRVALVEGARRAAVFGARVVVDELRELAVGHGRAAHVAHALLHRLHERVGEAISLLAPRVPRCADLRLDVGHLAVLVEADAARLAVLALAVCDESVRLGVAQEGVE